MDWSTYLHANFPVGQSKEMALQEAEENPDEEVVTDFLGTAHWEIGQGQQESWICH